MNFLFAWRYFKARKTTNAINFISWISILAIIVGTAALILVLSVFNGFEDLVKSLYSSFYPDMKIAPANGKVITLTAAQLDALRKIPGVRNVSLTAEEKALLQNGDLQTIIYLKGVDDEYGKVAQVDQHLFKGEYNLGEEDRPLLLLGAGIENAIGVQSDRNIVPLTVYLPRKTDVSVSDPLSNVNSDTVNTSGAFLIQQEFDNKYALTSLAFMRRILEMPESVYSSAEIALTAEADHDEVQEKISKQLGGEYSVLTRYEQNRSLYAVMRTEKWVIYAILSLILVVAAFNMIGALTMLVLEKKDDISVLHALGADRNFIMKIFLSEGLLLAVIGGSIGMVLALVLALLQIHYHLIPLQGGSSLIDYFPVKLNIMDFLLVSATILVIALVASWIPSRKAARQQYLLREE